MDATRRSGSSGSSGSTLLPLTSRATKRPRLLDGDAVRQIDGARILPWPGNPRAERAARQRRRILGALLILAAALRLWGLFHDLPVTYDAGEDATVRSANALVAARPDAGDRAAFGAHALAGVLVAARSVGAAGVPSVREAVAAHGLLLARLLALTCGLLTVALVYRAASQLFGSASAVAAAAAVAVAPAAVAASQHGGGDVIAGLLFALAMVLATTGGKRLDGSRSIAAAATLLLAILAWSGTRLIPVDALLAAPPAPALAIVGAAGRTIAALAAPGLAGLPALTLAAVGIVGLLAQRSTRGAGLLLATPLAMAVAVVGVAVLAGTSGTAAAAAMAALVPAACIAVGAGADRASLLAPGVASGRIVRSLLVVAVCVPMLFETVRRDSALVRLDSRAAAARWLSANLPGDARLAVDAAGPWRPRALTRADGVELATAGWPTTATLAGSGLRYVATTSEARERAFAAGPDAAVRLHRELRLLSPIATFDPAQWVGKGPVVWIYRLAPVRPRTGQQRIAPRK